ncbi:MAG: hypothetical protein HYU36_22325 [Planctomycetes bacterium]|nr:hypothetical protein [Planctomycetota bacterium]
MFSAIGGDAINQLHGIIATHSHEDHRRWFVDMALYKFYFSKPKSPLRLVASETVLEEFWKNSRGGLERTLSSDSRQVLEVPFTLYIEPIVFGPTARYRTLRCRLPGEEGSVWRVMDEQGQIVSPHRAKVVVHPEANRPRLIFRDFDTKRWVEPESYYPFTENRFYSDDQHPFFEPEIGITFEAHKCTAWHGPSTVSLRLTTPDEKIYFSSDTVYDPVLWKEMATTVRKQKLDRSQKEFDEAYILYGEINDYIEQTWSPARYERAMKLYDGHVLVHDVAGRGSVVHTNYAVLAHRGHKKLLLTHSPDHFVSEYPLTLTGKTIRIIGGEFFEEVDGELWPFNADVYFKDVEQSYVGYRARDGAYRVVKDGGILDVVPAGTKTRGESVMRVHLFRDLKGRYFPKLENANERYQEGPDGRVYRMTYTRGGGKMKAVGSIRGDLPLQARRRKVFA